MATENIKKRINLTQALVLFFVSVVCGAVASLTFGFVLVFSLIPMAVSAGALAALIHFECDRIKYLKYVSFGILALMDVAASLIFTRLFSGECYVSFIGVITVAFALMLLFAFDKKWPKCEVTLIISLITALLLVVMFVIIILANKGQASFADFCVQEYKTMRTDYVTGLQPLMDAANQAYKETVFTVELFESAFDFSFGILLSVIIAFCFVSVGISCKVYSYSLNKLGSDKAELEAWRFVPDSAYAYVYFILAFLDLFSGGEINAFSLSVANLSIIFMTVFTYVGLMLVISIYRSQKGKNTISLVHVALAIALLAVFPRILSYIGAFHCITSNRIKNNPDKENQ